MSSIVPPITISAVIPTYNRRKYVVRAIDSVISQQSPPNEIIVIDDGSTDGTAELLHSTFGNSLKIIYQENAGVSAARRRGIVAASGEWIAFLDSDDEWTSGRLDVFRQAISQTKAELAWIFGDTQIIQDDDTGDSLFALYDLDLIGYPTIFDNPLRTQFPFQFSILQSSLIKRSLLIELGAFLEDLRSSEDFLISFRAALRGTFGAVPQVVTRLYRTSELAESSLDRVGKGSSDYFRARVIAFDEAAARYGDPWRRLHEEAVRGLCWALAEEGRMARALSLQQFRHGISAKAIAFSLVSLFLGTQLLRTSRRLKHRLTRKERNQRTI